MSEETQSSSGSNSLLVYCSSLERAQVVSGVLNYRDLQLPCLVISSISVWRSSFGTCVYRQWRVVSIENQIHPRIITFQEMFLRSISSHVSLFSIFGIRSSSFYYHNELTIKCCFRSQSWQSLDACYCLQRKSGTLPYVRTPRVLIAVSLLFLFSFHPFSQIPSSSP